MTINRSQSTSMASTSTRLPPPPAPQTSYIRKRTHSFSVSHFSPTPTPPPAHLRAASAPAPSPQVSASLPPSRPGLQRRHAMYGQAFTQSSLTQTPKLPEDSHIRKEDLNERPTKRVAKEPRTPVAPQNQPSQPPTSSSSKPRWSLWGPSNSRSLLGSTIGSSNSTNRAEGSTFKRTALGFGRSRVSRSRSPSPSASTKKPVPATMSTEPTLGQGTPSTPYRPFKWTTSGSRIQEHLEDAIIEEDEEEEDDDEPSAPPGLPVNFRMGGEEDDNKYSSNSSKSRYSRGSTPEPEDSLSSTPIGHLSHKLRSPSPSPPLTGSPRFSSPLGPVRRILPPRPHMPRKPKPISIRLGAGGIRVESLGEKGAAAEMYRRVMVRNAKIVWRSVCERRRQKREEELVGDDEDYVLMVADDAQEEQEQSRKRLDEMDIDQESFSIDIDSLPDIPDLELEAFEQLAHSFSPPAPTQPAQPACLTISTPSTQDHFTSTTASTKPKDSSQSLVITIQLPSSPEPLSPRESQQIAIAQEALLMLALRPVELRQNDKLGNRDEMINYNHFNDRRFEDYEQSNMPRAAIEC